MAHSQANMDIRTSVRKRPGMYFGCTTSLGVVHAVNELVSNGIDQYLLGAASHIGIKIEDDTILYSDDGPGLPFDVAGPGGVSLAEHYLTCYHTTPTADDHVPHIHMLGHGLGLVCVNAASKNFTVKSWRSGCRWEQQFEKGLPIDGAQIVERGHGRGTSISFRIDNTVFKSILPCARTLRRLIFEAAHLFPGVRLSLGQEVFHAPNGLADLAGLYYGGESPLHQTVPEPFALNCRNSEVDVQVGAIGESDGGTYFRSWANGRSTPLHGTHVAGLRAALRSLSWEPAIAMIHVIMLQPEFAGPTRSSLNNAHVFDVVRDCVEPPLRSWRRERKSAKD